MGDIRKKHEHIILLIDQGFQFTMSLLRNWRKQGFKSES